MPTRAIQSNIHLPRSLALVAVALLAIIPCPALAQFRDTFEGPQATWSLTQADCGVRELAHERTYRDSHGGQASEHFRLSVGSGTFVFLTQPIGRAPVIAEFLPSIYVKSDRPNLQFLARVVFPRSIDRGTGQPITDFLRGESYTDVGQWQPLAIRDAARLVRESAVRLRTQFPAIDEREAYVDLLVINAYSAAGNIDLWIDDLEIQGYVNLDEQGGAGAPRIPRGDESSAAGQTGSPAASGPVSQLQGSLLLVRGRPIAPRVIQHQGEPLDRLISGKSRLKLSRTCQTKYRARRNCSETPSVCFWNL